MADTILTQPTAYLYNGHRLPKITFLDTYYYVIIYRNTIYEYELYCAQSPLTLEYDSNGYLLVRNGQNCIYKYDSRYYDDWNKSVEYSSQSKSYIKYLNTPIWANHKITYPDKSIYIEKGNEPSALYEGNVENNESDIDLYSWTMGLITGFIDDFGLIDNNAFDNNDNNVPIAYLYNGVRLPMLPEWDKNKYPYAVLTGVGSIISPYVVSFYSEMFVVFDAYYNGNWSLLVSGDDYLEITIKSNETEWSDFTKKALTGNLVADNNGIIVSYKKRLCNYDSDYIKWSNHSFNAPNDKEWIVASEPIPVYE